MRGNQYPRASNGVVTAMWVVDRVEFNHNQVSADILAKSIMNELIQ
jgi:hypothetical protein